MPSPNRGWRLPTFAVGDAYLVTILNWFAFGGVDLKKWPTLAA
ncbi:hypothetical protein [Reyranella sp.]